MRFRAIVGALLVVTGGPLVHVARGENAPVADAPAAAPAEAPVGKPAKAPRRARAESKDPARDSDPPTEVRLDADGTLPRAPTTDSRPGTVEPKEQPRIEIHPSDLAAGARPVVVPTETVESIAEHWQRRREDLVNRDVKRAAEEESEIERLQQVLALENLFGVSTALIREAHQLLAQGNANDALSRCREAVKVAPKFNAGWLCVARATLARDPTALGATFSALAKAGTVTFDDLRSRRNVLSDELLTTLFGLMLACAALVVLLIARYAGLFLHDFHHLFPKGVSRWQTAMVSAILVLLPLFFGAGLVGTVALSAVAVALFLSRSEAVAIAIAFALLSASQLLMNEVVREGAFGLAAHDVYMLERGDAPAASAARLEARVKAGLGDYPTTFALAHYAKRLGQLDRAKASYDAALKYSRTAEALNNLGNVLFINRDEEGAAAMYREANNLNPALAEPSYNLSTYYFRHSKLEEGKQARQAALATGGDLIQARVQVQDDFRANIYLIDVPLPDAAIEGLADKAAEQVVGVGGVAWGLATGRAGGAPTEILAVAAALLVALFQLLQKRVRPSTRCEKCGRPVCVRCDPELGSGSGMCGQCISVFVRRTGVDAPDRIRKEIEVRHFRRRHLLAVRLVAFLVGGGGHVLAGRIAGGAVFLCGFGLLLSRVLFWNGFLRLPVALEPLTSPVRVVFYVLLGLLLYGVSVRHLVKHEEPE